MNDARLVSALDTFPGGLPMMSDDSLNFFQAASSNDDLSPKERSGEWFLAYDASCGTCIGLAASVDEVADGRLNVVSLYAPTVAAWRNEAMGSTAPWTPTLLRVRGSKVEAWIGKSLVVRLGRLIGVRRAWHLAELIGTRADDVVIAASDSGAGINRRRMLLGLSGVAVGLVLASGFAESASADSAQACGLTYFTPVNRSGVSNGGNCRYCPNLNSSVNQYVPTKTLLGFETFTRDGGDAGNGNTRWWKTNGPAKCWMSETVLTIFS